jgi:hypothetical protein
VFGFARCPDAELARPRTSGRSNRLRHRARRQRELLHPQVSMDFFFRELADLRIEGVTRFLERAGRAGNVVVDDAGIGAQVLVIDATVACTSGRKFSTTTSAFSARRGNI